MSNLTVGTNYSAAKAQTGDLSEDGAVSVVGNTIKWPSNGWYEVQHADTFNTVSEGGQSASVDPGRYNVINHTTGERFEGLVVGSSNDNPGGIDPVPLPVIMSSLAELMSQNNVEVELADPELTDADQQTNTDEIDAGGDELYRYEEFDGELFVDGVSYTDIDQNQIGDCYLMTALASLARTSPEVIQNMITDNKDGTYTVHFGGGLGDVRVDDDFVVDQAGNVRYAGVGSSATPELWVAVVEKAYAQASGGYDDIEGGHSYKAINELTGHNDFTVDDVSDFSPADVAQALDEGRSVTASSFSSDSKKYDTSPDGIAGSHAYTVLDVSQDASGNWEVTLYNPWGGSGTNSSGAHRGEFTMSWDDFASKSNFRSMAVMNTPVPLAA